MLEWGRGEILNLIALPLVMIATYASTLAVPIPSLRRKLSIAILVVVIADVGAVVWLVYRDYWSVTPTPAPNIPQPSPTPRPLPSPFQPVQIEFQASPPNAEATRKEYCVVADFDGSITANEQAIDIVINEANLELCLYPKYGGTRLVSIRVGISANAGGKARSILWSQRKTITPKLGRGETYSPSEPIRLTIHKSRWTKLRQSAVFVEVTNRTSDSVHVGRYLLVSEGNQLTSN